MSEDISYDLITLKGIAEETRKVNLATMECYMLVPECGRAPVAFHQFACVAH
jgi:hypothetical protein